MTSFVHVDHPTEHPGVVRAERVVENVKALAARFDSARATATLLLAAIVAALMVVANQVIDTWSDGHLLAAWIVMWAVAFAALGLMARPAKRLAFGLRSFMKGRAARHRQAAQDEKLWSIALTDARVMADIGRAMSADASRETRRYY
jgi:hypothetical protein